MAEEFKRSFVEHINYLAGIFNNMSPESLKELENFFDLYKDELSYLLSNKDNFSKISQDLAKGTFYGKRKLDIDLSLNKKGIRDADDIVYALDIWDNQQTTVYYNNATVRFTDNSTILVVFTNDDNTPINISTPEELGYQLNKYILFTEKLVYTSAITDASGKVGNLLRITDVGSAESNIASIKLNVVSGDYVEKKPEYVWVDTTSALMLIFSIYERVMKLSRSADTFEAAIEEFKNIFDNTMIEQDLTYQINGVNTVFALNDAITENRISMLFYGGVLLPESSYVIDNTNKTLTTSEILNSDNGKELKLYLTTDIASISLSQFNDVFADKSTVDFISNSVGSLAGQIEMAKDEIDNIQKAVADFAEGAAIKLYDSIPSENRGDVIFINSAKKFYSWNGTNYAEIQFGYSSDGGGSSGTTIDANPLGTVLQYVGISEPAGYKFCNGQALSRTEYQALFSLIGITYGEGDHITTFNLPDYRGVFLRGFDNGRNLDPNRKLNELQGDAIRNITGRFNGVESHDVIAEGAIYVSGSGGIGTAKSDWDNKIYTFDASKVVPVADENRPINMAINYIIKTV
jgi:microcystin-dependent protein